MGISQPALSLAVRELEGELGTALFERVGRTSVLTAAGAALVGPARRALGEIEAGRAAVAAVSGLEAGTLRLACLPTLAVDPMAALIGRFRRLHPGIDLDLAACEHAREVVDLVTSATCDLGLIDAHAVPSSVTLHVLSSQALVLIFPPGTPTSAGSVRLESLRETPFVAAPVGTSTRRLLDEGFASVGLVPQVAVVTAQRDAIVPLVVHGAGAALVAEPLGHQADQLGAVVAQPEPSIRREVGLIHRPGPLASAATAFLAAVGVH